MHLDLGKSESLEVKIGASVYDMEAPSAKKANQYRKKLESSKGDEIDCFLEFVVDLGLPQDVAEALSVNQLKVLAEGIMGDPEKK